MRDMTSLIESSLQRPIVLRNVRTKSENLGMFIKEEGEYSFLYREYSNPKCDGRGNMIISTTISPEDNLVKKGRLIYHLFFEKSGATAIYDESDRAFERYSELLTSHGISPFSSE